ncbi:MAG: hypothetical protein QMC67_00330 [Candidatus Wallbacteria bacterium]
MSKCHFNKIIIIESLDNNKTAIDLHEQLNFFLTEKQNIILEKIISVDSKKQFFQELEKIKIICKNNILFKPVIHFELHGNKEGMVCKNNEQIAFYELINKLREINILTKNNLIVTTGVCFSNFLFNHVMIDEPAPFWTLLGSLEEVYEQEIQEVIPNFFYKIINNQSFSTIQKYLKTTKSKYQLITSEGFFLKLIKAYFNNHCNITTPETIKRINKFEYSNLFQPNKLNLNILNENHRKNFYECRSYDFFMKQFSNCKKRFSKYDYNWFIKNIN